MEMEEKTYAVFTADSVNAMAEAAGLPQVPDAVAAALGEDASYRLRQVVMLATQYMKHSKRRRLSVDDFNRAVKELGLMPVCGHGSQDPVAFRHIKDTEMHCVEDPEVNLCDTALGSYVAKNIGQPSIKAHWLAVEGTIKISSGSSSSSHGKSGKDLSRTHLEYYKCMTKALMSSQAEMKKKALQDLKSNPNIVPVLPYLVNFVVSGIKNMSHDLGHLMTMLNTVRALLHNRSLYLLHKPYLTTIVQGVEFCVLEPLPVSMCSANDHWILRDYAARLLAEIVNRWNSPQNHLRFNTVKYLREVWQDHSKPFYSHYGAVVGLIALGQKAIEDVILPHLSVYWPHLTTAMEDKTPENRVIRSDSQKVFGVLRLAAEKVMKKHLRSFQELARSQRERREVAEMLNLDENMNDDGTTEAGNSREKTNMPRLYAELYDYFGDCLVNCLPMVETQEVFRPAKKDDTISLGDENSGKSGEELLENLMKQIEEQEKMEQARKARELQERKEREKRERERQAREALQRRKREKEEEERQRQQRREEEEQRRRQLAEDKFAERQRRLKDEEEKKKKEWEEQNYELNRSRTKPRWQQEIEMRRLQLEEEIQYSRMMEAKKRQEQLKSREEEKRLKRQEEEMQWKDEDDDEEGGGRSRAGLRRRKPVNYTEKDDDISDLFDDPLTVASRQAPRLHPALPPHSDISEDSEEESKRLTGSPAEGIAVKKVIDPSKGLLKLKIKRQGGSHASTPPHPMSATPQHTPSSYHSPSMHSPMYSPLSSHSTPPPPPLSAQHSHHHQQSHRSKSSSGSEKESKHKKSNSGSTPKQSRLENTGIQDISDPEEPLYEKPHGSIPSQLYSPGGESSGSDSNPHRKALKLKLKLTPKESASE